MTLLETMSEEELVAAFMERKCRLFGMDTDIILALREQYLNRGGAFPITEASVKAIFDLKE